MKRNISNKISGISENSAKETAKIFGSNRWRNGWRKRENSRRGGGVAAASAHGESVIASKWRMAQWPQHLAKMANGVASAKIAGEMKP